MDNVMKKTIIALTIASMSLSAIANDSKLIKVDPSKKIANQYIVVFKKSPQSGVLGIFPSKVT
jgi:hypothetical protein